MGADRGQDQHHRSAQLGGDSSYDLGCPIPLLSNVAHVHGALGWTGFALLRRFRRAPHSRRPSHVDHCPDLEFPCLPRRAPAASRYGRPGNLSILRSPQERLAVVGDETDVTAAFDAAPASYTGTYMRAMIAVAAFVVGLAGFAPLTGSAQVAGTPPAGTQASPPPVAGAPQNPVATAAQDPSDPAPPPRKLQLSFDGKGNVTLIAQSVTLQEVLAEWTRLGNCYFPNADKLSREPLLPVQFENVPELRVLDSLLRSEERRVGKECIAG